MMEARKRAGRFATTLLALAFGFGAEAVLAGEVPDLPDFMEYSLIEGQTGIGISGAVGINMAAGNRNLQANAGAVAIGDQAMAATRTTQITGSGMVSLPGSYATVIRGSAFRDAKGWIGVNQASGAANAQSNSVAVAVGGGREMVSSQLAQVAASPRDPGSGEEGGKGERRALTVGKEAFQGAEGVVQVNQSAGNGNATSNHVGLAVER